MLEVTTGAAARLAGMLLADHGAEVIRLERASAPGADGSGPADVGHEAWVWDRGKRRARLGGAASARSEAAARLLGGADVCLVDGALEHLKGTALDPAAVLEAHPELVLAHLGPFGRSAPWFGSGPSETLAWAASGLPPRQASHRGGPVELVVPILSAVQGAWAATAVVAALIEREQSGRGQLVEAHAAHAAVVAGAAAYTFDDSAAEPPSDASRPGGPGGAVPFYRTYRCSDGLWLFLAALTPHFSQRAFAALGLEALPEDPRLGGGGRAAMLRPENSAWVIQEMAAVFARRTREEWLRTLAEHGCPAGPLLDREDWLDHPQIRANGMAVEVEDPEAGPVLMSGCPIELSASPPGVGGRRPQEDAASVDWDGPRRRLGRATTGGANRPSQGNGTNGGSGTAGSGGGPLAGVRVLDLGAIIAGPFAGSLLAELGADVVKVEPPAGDSFRGPGFAAYNKGQRGIVLDLQKEDGRAALLSLAAGADVVIDNYRPGVLGRLRITREDLARLNPAVVTVTITGFGTGGPLGSEAGFDPVLQAMSGMMTAQGGEGEPVFMTVPVNDVTAATLSALGACLAVFHRRRTGLGQAVRTSLAAVSTYLESGELVRGGSRRPPRRGGPDFRGTHPAASFHRASDGWIRVDGDRDPAALAVHIGALPAAEAVDRLAQEGVAAVAVPSVRDLARHPELAPLGLLHPDPRPGRESWWTPGRQVLFSRTPRTGTLVAPGLGEHTREVLLAAGLTPDQIDALVAAGAAAAP